MEIMLGTVNVVFWQISSRLISCGWLFDHVVALGVCNASIVGSHFHDFHSALATKLQMPSEDCRMTDICPVAHMMMRRPLSTPLQKKSSIAIGNP